MEELDVRSTLIGFHEGLYESHKYVMLTNGLLSFYVMLKSPRYAFNFNQPFIPATLALALNCAILPGFYFLESIPLFQNCSENDLQYCKFAIHHAFTVVLFLVIYQFQLYSGPAMAVQATHGIMNFLSYFDQLTTSVWCQWYIVSTLICSLHVLYHCLFSPLIGVPKAILWIQLVVLAVVGVNNFNSSELLTTCIRPVDTNTVGWDCYVYVLHAAFAAASCYVLWRYTHFEDLEKDKSK